MRPIILWDTGEGRHEGNIWQHIKNGVLCWDFHSFQVCHYTGGDTVTVSRMSFLQLVFYLLLSFVSSCLWSLLLQKSIKDRTEWKRNYNYVQYFRLCAALFLFWYQVYPQWVRLSKDRGQKHSSGQLKFTKCCTNLRSGSNVVLKNQDYHFYMSTGEITSGHNGA